MLTNYPNGVSSFGVPLPGILGIGNVYYVVNAADTAVVNQMRARFGSQTYDDGSAMLYEAQSLTASEAIQAALDACVANRNDYVVVMPSNTNYSIVTTLTMSKKGVHVICPTGLGSSFPIGNTARLKSIVAATPIFTIAAGTEAFEIAGFYLKNYADVAAITLAAGVSAQNIHHNMFPLVWSAAPVASIVGTGSGGAWGSIGNNWFISETGTGVTAAIAAIDIKAQATGCRTCNNEVTIGDGNTATVAISNLAVKGRVDNNSFSEAYSANVGACPTGTITNCIAIQDGVTAIGNVGAVATGRLITGGTANHSFSRNFDAASGGATPVEA